MLHLKPYDCRTRLTISTHSLYWQLELLALHDSGVVDVEEVAIQNSLDKAGDNSDPVRLVLGLGEVTVDPVGDVQRAVAAQGEQIVGGDGLGLTSALEHKQLREDSHRLEPDGEGPEDLGEGVLVREKDCENGGATEEVLDAEGIDVGIVCGLVGVGHEVDDVALGADEEDLEDEVVDAIRREEIC
jgi:hypothetical protein